MLLSDGLEGVRLVKNGCDFYFGALGAAGLSSKMVDAHSTVKL